MTFYLGYRVAIVYACSSGYCQGITCPPHVNVLWLETFINWFLEVDIYWWALLPCMHIGQVWTSQGFDAWKSIDLPFGSWKSLTNSADVRCAFTCSFMMSVLFSIKTIPNYLQPFTDNQCQNNIPRTPGMLGATDKINWQSAAGVITLPAFLSTLVTYRWWWVFSTWSGCNF